MTPANTNNQGLTPIRGRKETGSLFYRRSVQWGTVAFSVWILPTKWIWSTGGKKWKQDPSAPANLRGTLCLTDGGHSNIVCIWIAVMSYYLLIVLLFLLAFFLHLSKSEYLFQLNVLPQFFLWQVVFLKFWPEEVVFYVRLDNPLMIAVTRSITDFNKVADAVARAR